MKKIYLLIFLLIISTLGCHDRSSRTYYPHIHEYTEVISSSSDNLRWILDYDTHTFEFRSLNLQFSGSFGTLPSGFLRLVVQSIGFSSSSYPRVGDVFYALEAPHAALFIRSESSPTYFVGVSKGFCGDFMGDFNWVNLFSNHHLQSSGEAYGTTRVTEDTWSSGVTVTGQSYDIFSQPLFPYSFSQSNIGCFDGEVQGFDFLGGLHSFSRLFSLRERGFFLTSVNDLFDGTIGLAKSSWFTTAETVSGYSSFPKSYSGLILYDPSVSNLDPQPIRLDFFSTHEADTFNVLNLNTNSTSSPQLRLEIFNVNNGIILGDLHGRFSSPFIGIATHTSNDGPDNVLFLLALDPNGSGYINIVLTSD